MARIYPILRVFGGLVLTWLFLFPLPAAAYEVKLPLVLNSAGPIPNFTVINNCNHTIWVQQDYKHKLPDTPLIQKIESKKSFDYQVEPNGISSTRFWPKWGCNEQTGKDCTWGQSSGPVGIADDYPPCPANGCHPAVDSLMEITWGCAFPDPTNNPLCDNKAAVTTYDGSLVDGYSLPFKITRSGDTASSCQDIDCSSLKPEVCPTNEDVSRGNRDKTTTYPEYSSVNLQVPNYQGGPSFACFSPCGYLSSASLYGGRNYLPQDEHAILYCCPVAGGILSPECNAGPVPNTQYVNLIHQKCPKTYGFSYDDLHGLYNCHYSTKLTLTYCPASQ